MKQELDKKGNENEREKEAMAEKEDQKMKVEHKQNLKKKETKTEKEQDSADLCGGGEPLAAESLGDPAQQQSVWSPWRRRLSILATSAWRRSGWPASGAGGGQAQTPSSTFLLPLSSLIPIIRLLSLHLAPATFVCFNKDNFSLQNV